MVAAIDTCMALTDTAYLYTAIAALPFVQCLEHLRSAVFVHAHTTSRLVQCYPAAEFHYVLREVRIFVKALVDGYFRKRRASIV